MPSGSRRLATVTPGQAKSFIEVLSEGPRPRTTAPLLPAAAPEEPRKVAGKAALGPAEGKGLRGMAERALDAEKRVDALLATVGRGRTFSAAELIALQATVFRYSQTVEVISRATDRLVGAIKQTLGTQV
jgi:hypothetical protein